MKGADLKIDHITRSLSWHFISDFLLDDIPWEVGDKFEGFRWNYAEASWQLSVPLTSLYIQMFALKFYEGYQLIMQYLRDLATFYGMIWYEKCSCSAHMTDGSILNILIL